MDLQSFFVGLVTGGLIGFVTGVGLTYVLGYIAKDLRRVCNGKRGER